jgi:hypothetical protein
VPGLLPDVDREGLLEYSVVYTDRSINHMSQLFQGVMRDISDSLKKVYKPLHGSSQRTGSVLSSGMAGSVFAGRRFSTWAAFRLNRSC